MLADGRIRGQVVLIADAVQDDVQVALADVLREASTRRRRLVVTRLATVAVVMATTAGVWFVSGWSFTEQSERQQPADDMMHQNPQDPTPEERSEIEDHGLIRDGERNGGGILGPIKAPMGHRAPSGSAGARRSGSSYSSQGGFDHDRATGEFRDDPLQEPSRERISRRGTAKYQMPVVRPRVDPRQSCSVLGEGCVGFDTRPEDRFIRVTVRDDSGAPVLVRITQWDSHGRTVADPTVYCGGASQKLKILPATESLVVEINDGDCGTAARPSGGRVDFVFFHE
ncbi:MAG: hypothetical protein ABR505_06125 [Actinomycetota bacterium]